MIRRAAPISALLAFAVAETMAAAPPTIVVPPPGSGPVAQAHTRTWRHHRKTVRMIRRTPQVMQEDAARIRRGDLFSTWSNAAAGSGTP
ncbi:MAG: hypothetical protein ACKO4Z_13900 [Planctomycetota bacterium]|nr:hypothetical protein [Planctomycetota bacterium]